MLLPWAPSGRALDLGGGHGRYGHALAKGGHMVTLFDREICCEIARRALRQATSRREPATSWWMTSADHASSS